MKNEFRLGNYVELYGSLTQIHRADFAECKCSHGIAVDKGKPIKLTEDWLKNLGFDNKNYKKGFIGIICGSTDFVLTYPKIMGEWQNEFCWTFDNYKFVTIKYVHELQNLYFLLSHGKELSVHSECAAAFKN